MRKHTLVVAVLAVVFVSTGCHKSGATGSSGSGSSSASYGVAGDIPDGSTRRVSIEDPILNMTAYTMTIPAKWEFAGEVLQGTSCSAGPFPVFRIISPDGLYGIKALPRLDWAWSESKYTPKNGSDCMPFKSQMPAKDLLKYMIGVLHVQYIRDEVPPGKAQFLQTLAAHSTPQQTLTGDSAGARVQYKIHNITIEERLVITEGCLSNQMLMLGRQHTCNMYVGRYWAPAGKFADATFTAIAKSLVINQQWSQRWSSQVVAQLKAIGDANTKRILGAMDAAQQQRNAAFNEFQQAQAVRQQQSDQFIQSIHDKGQHTLDQIASSAAVRQQSTNDWCDFALDVQRRQDPNTGEISRDSNLYNYSWVNESGDHLQTNDINENPNGNGTGNWTLQDNVK